jgi:hypothetical protein
VAPSLSHSGVYTSSTGTHCLDWVCRSAWSQLVSARTKNEEVVLHPDSFSKGMIYHTINMTLAAMRLSSFSETLGEVEEKIPSWTSFAGNFSSNVSAMIRGGGTIASKSHSGAALAEVLIRQGA